MGEARPQGTRRAGGLRRGPGGRAMCLTSARGGRHWRANATGGCCAHLRCVRRQAASEGTQLPCPRTQRRPLGPKRALGFLLERGGGAKWRLPGPMSADVRHMAPTPGPLRSPPALRVPWGHAPPIWRPGGPRRRPHHARFGRWLGRRAWSAAARVVTYGCCATYPRPEAGMGGLYAPWGPSGLSGVARGVPV